MFDAGTSEITFLLAVGLLAVVLVVYLLKSPWNYLSWFSIWVMVLLLFVARVRPHPLLGTMYFPLIDVNQHLSGPSFLVMPCCLLASWIALRPATLHRRWRPVAIIVLSVVVSLTTYFLVLMGNRPFQVTVISFVEHAGILGTGPMLILAGGVVLLAAECSEILRDGRRSVAPEGMAPAKSPYAEKGHRVGFWSALLASISSLLGIILSLLEVSSPVMEWYDAGVIPLIEGLKVGAALLMLISFVVLMGSISRYAPPQKRVLTRVGFLLAIAYAFMWAINAYLYSVVSGISPQLYERLTTSFPILREFGALGALSFALVSLSLLFALPVFYRGGVERVIRWWFALLGVLTMVSGLGYLLSDARIPLLGALANLMAESVVFPVAMALVAVAFHRRESTDARRSDGSA